jgi:hypothetical protein
MRKTASVTCLLFALLTPLHVTAEPPNLHAIPSDLSIPEMTDGLPAAGRRVRQTNPGYEGWDLYHTLYLPTDWRLPAGNATPSAVGNALRGVPPAKFPVIVEYPGNGGYQNALGDMCTGKVEDCKLGYGLSAGQGFIWVCLPFVNHEEKKHALNWWGDPDATADYCVQTVKRVCDEFGGDPEAVVLTGFSRGAIACNYIGLRDGEIARLWCAMLPHSHYDGVRRWPYADSDAGSAAARLQRLGSRPQFISHEMSVEATRDFLGQHAPQGNFTFVALPCPNHSDAWVLKDIPERAQARRWLADVLKNRQRP